MITTKEAREKSRKIVFENRPVKELLENIKKYILEACDRKETEMNYVIDGVKYSYKTFKKAIRLLKREKYFVSIVRVIKPEPNDPCHIMFANFVLKR